MPNTKAKKEQDPSLDPSLTPQTRVPLATHVEIYEKGEIAETTGMEPCTKKCPRNSSTKNGGVCKVMALSAWHGWQQMQERKDFCQGKRYA